MKQKPLNKMMTPLTKEKSEVLDRTERYINDTLAQANKELAEMETALEKLKEQEAQALDDMETAAQKADADAYLKANTEHAKAIAEQEAVKKFIANKKATPLISQGEYEKYCNAVRAAVGNQCDEIRVRIADHAEAMAAQGDELEALQARANTILANLQDQLYKGADRQRDPAGNMIYFILDDQRVDLTPLMNWARHPSRSTLYSETKR